MTDEIELFDYPLSFYCSVVRLCLIEKKIPFKKTNIDIGPRMENYQPWYMKLNPRGVVPTLRHGENYITDCFRILYYVEQNIPGEISLHFNDYYSSRKLDDYILPLYSFPMRELTTSRTFTGWFGYLQNKWNQYSFKIRKQSLENYAKRYPTLEEHYNLRLEDLEEWKETISSYSCQRSLEDRIKQLIDDLEVHLVINQNQNFKNEWLIGNQYSLIDVLWTSILAHLHCLEMNYLWENSQHTQVKAYFSRLKARPSFKKAGLRLSFSKYQMIFLFIRSSLWSIIKYLFFILMFFVLCFLLYYDKFYSPFSM